MRQRKFFVVLTAGFLFFALSGNLFGAAGPTEFLCEFGISFYEKGRYEEALTEFNKALLLDPGNQTAKEYISDIFAEEMYAEALPRGKETSREDAIESALDSLDKSKTGKSIGKEEFRGRLEKKAEAPANEIAEASISGEAQLRLGMSSEDSYWKRANWDLNEKNYRMVSNTALNRRENSFDPRIYDRLKLKVDAGNNNEGFGLHSNIVVDPWSYTGKSEMVNVASGGDFAQFELKYWSNTGYSVNETINTLRNADSFSLEEIKVKHDKTDPFSIGSAFGNTFNVPEIKIHREFQPIRELWFDYKSDSTNLRFYPIAYENQAVTFDDPLRLSNNHIWWEDSPWIRAWRHGINNSSPAALDFTKGYWDKTLSFFTRDSEGQRLTSLRGFNFYFSPQEETSITTSVATPKNPWQNYEEADNVLSATRLKQNLSDSLNLGVTATTRAGYNLDDKNKLDAWNYVVGTDLEYEISEGLQTSFEVARSQRKYDITDSVYKTKAQGNAYHLSLMGRFPAHSILDTEHGYNGIQAEKEEGTFTKFRLFAVRMDDSFDAPLSSYVETRDDEFWSRHLHFRTPFKYYYQGENRLLTWDDIKPYSIGDGIDVGRSTLGLRVESLFWEKTGENLFDVRNVHRSNGKFVENVAREELTLQMNDQLTGKLLGIYHRLPKTAGGIDPFVFNTTTGRYFSNNSIEDGKDPSISTGSLGLEYKFFEWMALNGIWEYTNDISLGYDNFPRGILNGGSRSYLFYEEGNKYRDSLDWLNGQQYFPKPPYPYYNIFKTGLRFNPMDKMELYLDYTRNPFEKAGQTDDNMNHIGLEMGYTPIQKLSLFFKYNYSRWQDLDAISQGITKVYGHHNIFTEMIYRQSEDEDFTFQYGEASRDPFMGGVLDIGWDPYGGALRTIDTAHIFRLYYRRKF